jgi:uncharacterized protein DUF4124
MVRYIPKVPAMIANCHFGTCAASLAALFVPFAACAEVYKCAGDNGTPVYQEMPCTTGRELRNFQTDPPEITILPGPTRGTAAPAVGSDAARKDAKPGRDPASAKPAKPAKADASERRHMRAGMTQGEVLAKLGAPDVTANRNKQVRWTWLPADGDLETITTLTLVGGVVTDVERKVVKK